MSRRQSRRIVRYSKWTLDFYFNGILAHTKLKDSICYILIFVIFLLSVQGLPSLWWCCFPLHHHLLGCEKCKNSYCIIMNSSIILIDEHSISFFIKSFRPINLLWRQALCLFLDLCMNKKSKIKVLNDHWSNLDKVAWERFVMSVMMVLYYWN